MIVNLSPVRSDEFLQISKIGTNLLVNGESFDFSQLQNGETLPRNAIQSRWFAGDVKRIAGVLHVVLVFPHGPYADEAARFPMQITVTQDGPVHLPSTGHETPQFFVSEPAEEVTHEQH